MVCRNDSPVRRFAPVASAPRQDASITALLQRRRNFAGRIGRSSLLTARFDEAFAVLKQAFASKKRFSHHGTYWHFDNVLVEPQPAQLAHPPLWIAAGNPCSIRRAAELGCNLLLDQFQSPAQIKERISLYRSVVEAHGRSFDPLMMAVARNVYVAEGAADREAALTRQIAVHRRMVELSQRVGASNRSHILQYDTAPGRRALRLGGRNHFAAP